MSPERGPGFSGRLRIGSYNIAHGRGDAGSSWQVAKKAELLKRLDEIALVLKDERLDVAVLNEVDVNSFRTRGIDQVHHIARQARLPFRASQCHIDLSLGLVKHQYGNAVLSRHPISRTRQVSFPGHSFWETALLGKKAGLLCTMTLPDTREIRIMAVHLEHRLESNRIKAARRIEEARIASPAPLILAGDFNSTRLDYPMAVPTDGGQTALSWLLDTGAYRTLPSGQPQEDDMTFPASHPSTVIDWILVPRDWEIVSKRVIATTLSDHRPVVLEVQVPARSPARCPCIHPG
jgi:endonuclease/exonuclease/phosphatase family metal-dependent hydrolase